MPADAIDDPERASEVYRQRCWLAAYQALRRIDETTGLESRAAHASTPPPW